MKTEEEIKEKIEQYESMVKETKSAIRTMDLVRMINTLKWVLE